MTIRRLKQGEFDLYRKVRLRALQEAPYAFGSTYEEASQRTDAIWKQQAEEATTGPDRAIFVIMEEEAVGLAAIYRSKEQPAEGDLFQVWIAPHLRGGSSAIELMDEAFRWASCHDFQMIRADVTEENPRALRFYEHYGFTCEPEKHENGDWGLKKRV